MKGFFWVLLLLLFATAAAAQERIWSWKDKSGVVHYTDDPEKLPEPMRSEALRELEKNPPPPKAPAPTTGSEQPPPEPEPAPAPSVDGTGSAVEKAKRRRELKASVMKKHGAYLELKKSCNGLEEKLVIVRRDGHAMYGRPSGGSGAAELEGQLKECLDDLSRAREELKQEISEARRMGASVQVDFDQ